MSTASTPSMSQISTIPYIEDPNVTIDGNVLTDEYAGHYFDSDTKIDIYWEHNGTHMYIALVSPGTGWVGIGFGPMGVGMDGANIIIGWVDSDGKLVLYDEVGVGWNHLKDVEKGGSDDIIEKAGSESEGKTTLEFIIPLDSGDPNDQSFAEGGKYGFFVAYHATEDSDTTYHISHSKTIDIYIEPPPTPNILPNANFTYIIHGFKVEFIDQSSDEDGNITSWLWNFGGEITSEEQNPTYTFTEMGTFTVSLTVTDNLGGTSTTSQRIMVPSPEERLNMWVTQVAAVSIAISLLSLSAVGISVRLKRLKERK